MLQKNVISQNIDLKPYNTFGISVRADKFARFSNVEQLKSLVQQAQSQPLLILGGGSNILFTEESVPKFILKNEIKGFEIRYRTDNYVFVRVGAGEVWHEFIERCLNLGFGGLENLSLIPGNVGASPMQNIGAYGVEIKDVFDSLDAFNIKTQKIETFYNLDCQFGYRESVFKHYLKDQYVIVNVTFLLTTRKHNININYRALKEELEIQEIINPTIHDVSRAVIAVRRKKLPDPQELGNAGSFFKNPIISIEHFVKIQEKYENIPHFSLNEQEIKIPAGWLIEQAGWKGKKINKCGVHDKQALVLVNYGGAKGKEVLNLAKQIIEDVKLKFEISLQTEVNFV